jgi:hypothetical protein
MPTAATPLASFLLGYMSDASATINVNPYWSWKYPVLFFQDDWQVNRQLTLNLGLRWDYESPPVERFDRQNRGFDFTVKSPYQVPGFDLRGGLLFAGVNDVPRTTFERDRNNWQPRVGAAYRPFSSKPLVLRGGVGRYFFPLSDWGTTNGFSQVTNAVTSTPDYLPFTTVMNPFPNGLIQPPGSSRGLATQVGDSLSFADPTRVVPYVWQFSGGFQYELWAGIVVDASYVGSRSKQIQVNRPLSYLTAEQLALGTPYLNQSVPNPFYGVLPNTTPRGAQADIQRRSLLVQYPQYTGLTSNFSSLGSSWYNAFQLRVEKRFSRGLTALVSYTNSKTLESVAYLNSQDQNLTRELVSWDVPQRLVIGTLYEFPVGPGKRWASRGIVSHIVGGWQLGLNLLKQSGTPMSYPDWYLYGNPKLESGQTLSRWFDTSRQIWVQRPADTLRTTPLRSPNIRRHTAPQMDAVLIRNFRIRDSRRPRTTRSTRRFSISRTRVRRRPCSAWCRPRSSTCRGTWNSASGTRFDLQPKLNWAPALHGRRLLYIAEASEYLDIAARQFALSRFGCRSREPGLQPAGLGTIRPGALLHDARVGLGRVAADIVNRQFVILRRPDQLSHSFKETESQRQFRVADPNPGEPAGRKALLAWKCDRVQPPLGEMRALLHGGSERSSVKRQWRLVFLERLLNREIENRRGDVEKRHGAGNRSGRLNPAGETDDQRHAQNVLVEMPAVADIVVLAEALSMIRRQHDESRIAQA